MSIFSNHSTDIISNTIGNIKVGGAVDKPIVNLTVYDDRSYKPQEQPTVKASQSSKIVIFGNLAKLAAKQLVVGDKFTCKNAKFATRKHEGVIYPEFVLNSMDGGFIDFSNYRTEEEFREAQYVAQKRNESKASFNSMQNTPEIGGNHANVVTEVNMHQ